MSTQPDSPREYTKDEVAALSDAEIRGHFLIRRAKNGHLDNQKVSEKNQHMAEKLSLRYVEIRGLF